MKPINFLLFLFLHNRFFVEDDDVRYLSRSGMVAPLTGHSHPVL